MDTRDSPEQAELRRVARQLTRELGPSAVADLDNATRVKRLALAVRESGWLEFRDDSGDGAPLASGVEACIVAEALGAAVAEAAFAGPILAADLARRAGCAESAGATVGFERALVDAAVAQDSAIAREVCAIDSRAEGIDHALVLVPDGECFGLARVSLPPAGQGADLTRDIVPIKVGTTAARMNDQRRMLTRDDLDAWSALGLALTSADLVGVMRGVLDISVAYASDRRQYGVPIGSFQAIQHLLAEARCLMEGSSSVALYASWAVDNLPAPDARAAGQVAKAYCARAARTVCETAIQVHGGIGNTWECMVHVYLRRALLSTQWFGDDGEQLRRLANGAR
jgi:alkylation response protein AidB-like acyl-CoA dehydrogenase